jgi:predicted nucleic acid-binding protein
MIGPVLLDTGPLVALLDRRDRYHDWAKARFGEIQAPQWTCEAVLTEASHLLRRQPDGGLAVLDLLPRGVIAVAFHLDEEVPAIRALMGRYANVPMSLADACLVRMAECIDRGQVLTLDSDFRIYRKHGQEPIAAILPEGR